MFRSSEVFVVVVFSKLQSQRLFAKPQTKYKPFRSHDTLW